MDLAVLQVHRQPGGAVDAGLVAVGPVGGQALVAELRPASVRGALAGLGEVDAVGERRLGEVDRVVEGEPAGAGRRVDRAPPAVRRPRLREGREDAVGLAVVLGHPPRRHGVRRPGADQLDALLGQRLLDRRRRAPARTVRSPRRRGPARHPPPSPPAAPGAPGRRARPGARPSAGAARRRGRRGWRRGRSAAAGPPDPRARGRSRTAGAPHRRRTPRPARGCPRAADRGGTTSPMSSPVTLPARWGRVITP